jgi:class I fructose-bisphosphate aldolase
MASEAMEAGAYGVVFGRNVFQSADPAKMVAALAKVVHDGATVASAAALLAA